MGAFSALGATPLSENIPGIGGLQAVQEDARRLRADDDKYYRDLLYFFELVVPRSIGGSQTSFLLPMVLNPEEYTCSEPFSVSATPTAGGGLYVEEDGIIQREIRIRGNTGFKPRRYFGSNFRNLTSPENRSFARKRALAKMTGIEGVSGQRHFQFLQDAIFRTYGDLKRDPATARDTILNFHVLKDDDHWRVVPRRFDMRRSTTLYHYDIDLLVVGPAKAQDLSRPEDKNVLDAIKDGLRMVKSGVDTVNGVLQDLTGMVDEIRRTVNDVSKIFTAVTDIVSNAADFVNGTADLIASPFTAATSVLTSLDSALDRMSAAGSNFPATIKNAFHQMQDGFSRITAHPEVFETPSQALLSSLQNQSELTTSRTRSQLQAVAVSAAPTSFAEQAALGTGNTPGDLLKARGELGIGRDFQRYRSTEDHEVKQGDTLQGLAGALLGDARYWRHIAVLNDLKEPYISDEGLPGTRGIGDKILIPSQAPPPEQRLNTPVIGVRPTVDPAKRILGTDLQLSALSGPGNLFDIPIDVEGGRTDVKLVDGIQNLRQALLIRLTTERGRDLLYQNLGLERIVAVRVPGIDSEIIRLRITQAIEDDPRILNVREIRVSGSSADAVEVDVDAEVIGLSGTTPLNVSGVR